MANMPTSFNQLGSQNSSHLINFTQNIQGYLAVFTTQDTHIQSGDTVYISNINSGLTLR